MKKLLCLLVLLSACGEPAAAQDRAGVDPTTPALVAGEPTWVDVHVNASPGNPYSNGGGRRFGYRPDSSRPQHVRNAVAQAYPRSGASGGKVFFPSWRAASVEVTNAGAREVKRISLDFVFRDAPAGREVLRLSHRAGKRLRAGERAVLKKTVKGTARHRRGDGAPLAVEIKEVVYADGTVWRAGAGR